MAVGLGLAGEQREEMPSMAFGALVMPMSAKVGKKDPNARGEIADLARRHASRPVDNQGDADAAFVEVSFEAAQRPLLWWNLGSTPPSACGPLSLVKMTTVLVRSFWATS